MNKDSFHDDTDFVAWWTTLLLLQITKASLGIRAATHMDALDDACEIIEEKTRCSSRWSMENMAWKTKDPVDTDDEDDRETQSATTSQEWLELEKHARNRTVAACDQGQCTPALPMCTTQIITP